MTKDDIIRMAREAGINVEQAFLLRFAGVEDDLERFAALVAAAEREACARVCEEPGWNAANWCAKAIRARNTQNYPEKDNS